MNFKKAMIAAVLALVLSAHAFAETQNVKVSGVLDAYWFQRSNFDLRDNNDIAVTPVGTAGASYNNPAASATHRSDTDNYVMSITQVEVAADLTDNVSTVINILNMRDWNADTFTDATTSTAVGANEFDLSLDLAYVQMKEIFYSPLTLTIGRQDLLFGRGFIVGWNPVDPQGATQADEFTQLQAFDAVRATLDFNPWTIDLVYALIDENSNNPEDDRDLYIANVNYKFAEYNAVAEAYYVGEIDKGTLAGTAGTHDNNTHTVGGRVQFDPISQITLGGELAYQFGNYRSALANPRRDRDAWAADVFGTYRWDYTWKPEVTVEYVMMSGESDLSATTNDFGSWNAPFRGPTYGWIHEYKETNWGTAQTNDQATGQNNQFISVAASIKPLEDLLISAVYYHFWAPDDMHTTITDPTSAVLDDHLGDEIDTQITYAYTEDVSFGFMADWYIPGGLYASNNDKTASQYVSSVHVTF